MKSVMKFPPGTMLGGLLVHMVLLAVLVGIVFLLYFSSASVMNLQNGFIICNNDCSDFNWYSQYILEHKRFYPRDADFHSSHFYRGYTLFVAVIKGLFGEWWGIAYTALGSGLLFAFVVWVARILAPPRAYWPCLAVAYVFAVANLNLLTYARTLLSDFPVALGAGFFFVTIAVGLARKSWNMIGAALALALGLGFVRPNGLFLLALGLAAAIPFAVPQFRRWHLHVAGPMVAGAAIFVLAAIATAAAVQGFDRVGDLPGFLQQSAQQLLKFNYLGEEDLTPSTRLGAIIVNFPYKEVSLNDGGALGIALGFTERIAKVFEIGRDGFSTRNNTYRYLYYGGLYVGSAIFLLAALRNRGERLHLLVLAAGYLLVFVSLSHVTTRFRLVFDILLLASTVSATAWLVPRIKARRDRILGVEEHGKRQSGL